MGVDRHHRQIQHLRFARQLVIHRLVKIKIPGFELLLRPCRHHQQIPGILRRQSLLVEIQIVRRIVQSHPQLRPQPRVPVSALHLIKVDLVETVLPSLVVPEIILVKTGRSAVRDQGVHSHRRMPFPVKVLRDFPSQLVVAAIVSQQAQISPDVKREHGGRVHIESPHVQISRRRLPVRPIVDCVGRHAASVLHILEGQPRIHARQILVFRVLVHDELRVQLIQPHLRPVRIAQTVNVRHGEKLPLHALLPKLVLVVLHSHGERRLHRISHGSVHPRAVQLGVNLLLLADVVLAHRIEIEIVEIIVRLVLQAHGHKLGIQRRVAEQLHVLHPSVLIETAHVLVQEKRNSHPLPLVTREKCEIVHLRLLVHVSPVR